MLGLAAGRYLADVPPDEVVSPGIWGFGIFFALAVVCWFLFRSFSKRVRGADLRAEARSRAAAAAQTGPVDSRVQPAEEPDGGAPPPPAAP